ncbi:MAG: aminomethyl-transferring glycine dehydrogenase subunit GcvPA [Nitrospirae bacterium]|nr:aminomethyl-transferring glycine dehydrogenase subunit GcvPA [Nitrospirota bacterium]MBI3351548.1 aminomethyl-transferring glycine dehydrogenase subunit GcvPA [Nitrospirota bacterium]
MPYTPHTPEDIQSMLQTIGVDSLEALLDDIPKTVRFNGRLKIGRALSELEVRSEIKQLNEKNADLEQFTCFLGAGSYDHYIPAVIGPLLFRSEFYTAYTPYQAELSQGMLQAIYEFQTGISELTGMEVANASLYDGASALAEAVLMMIRISKKKSEILLPRTIHPFYREVIRTYCHGLDLKFVEIPYVNGVTPPGEVRRLITEDTAGLLLQFPNFFGNLEEVDELIQAAHEKGAKVAVSIDPIAMGLFKSPGEMGADIVVGEGQAMGNAMSYGGPYVGFFATKLEYARQLPGRIVGATHDKKGRKGYCLTLQTREQHIKRERATSNICTNESLNALAMLFYMATIGKQGLGEVAVQSTQKAHYLQKELSRLKGISVPWPAPFFKEFTLKTSKRPKEINQHLLKEKIVGGLDLGDYYPELENHVLFCVTEKRTKVEMDRLVETISKVN